MRKSDKRPVCIRARHALNLVSPASSAAGMLRRTLHSRLFLPLTDQWYPEPPIPSSNMYDSDDVPFNPFYIGPHPSKACAAPEDSVQQCSPDCQEDPAKQASAAPPAGQAGGILIVGMVGPSGGVATIYSTIEAQVAAAKGLSPDNPCAGGKMIECMQGRDPEKPCE